MSKPGYYYDAGRTSPTLVIVTSLKTYSLTFDFWLGRYNIKVCQWKSMLPEDQTVYEYCDGIKALLKAMKPTSIWPESHLRYKLIDGLKQVGVLT